MTSVFTSFQTIAETADVVKEESKKLLRAKTEQDLEDGVQLVFRRIRPSRETPLKRIAELKKQVRSRRGTLHSHTRYSHTGTDDLMFSTVEF